MNSLSTNPFLSKLCFSMHVLMSIFFLLSKASHAMPAQDKAKVDIVAQVQLSIDEMENNLRVAKHFLFKYDLPMADELLKNIVDVKHSLLTNSLSATTHTKLANLYISISGKEFLFKAISSDRNRHLLARVFNGMQELGAKLQYEENLKGKLFHAMFLNLYLNFDALQKHKDTYPELANHIKNKKIVTRLQGLAKKAEFMGDGGPTADEGKHIYCDLLVAQRMMEDDQYILTSSINPIAQEIQQLTIRLRQMIKLGPTDCASLREDE